MSSTYIQTTIQVVFATKFREPTLLKPKRANLHAYMAGLLRMRGCHVYQVGGVEDHVHLVFNQHPSVALAKLVKDLKILTSRQIKTEWRDDFPTFSAWQRGYGAFAYPYTAVPNLVRYVRNQEAHHRTETSQRELRRYLAYHNIPYDDRYFS